MATEAGQRRRDRRAVCRRHRDWIPEQIGRRAVLDGAYRTISEVRTGTASREDASFGIRAIRCRKPKEARTREAGDVQLPRLHAHLREEEEQWTVHGGAADDPQAVAGEAERGESRAAATQARPDPRGRHVVALGCRWAHPLLRGADEQPS